MKSVWKFQKDIVSKGIILFLLIVVLLGGESVCAQTKTTNGTIGDSDYSAAASCGPNYSYASTTSPNRSATKFVSGTFYYVDVNTNVVYNTNQSSTVLMEADSARVQFSTPSNSLAVKLESNHTFSSTAGSWNWSARVIND